MSILKFIILVELYVNWSGLDIHIKIIIIIRKRRKKRKEGVVLENENMVTIFNDGKDFIV